MQVAEFDFTLPPELIAQAPARPRDSARLMYLAADAEAPRDLGVRDLPGLLAAGDVMVFNDTRVIPARLTGKRGDATRPGRPEGGAKVEVTLHRWLDSRTWRAFAKPARKLHPRDYIVFAAGFGADVLEKLDGGEVVLRFTVAGAELRDMLERHGRMPLPPYIKRDDSGDPQDRDDYQTMFADKDGAVAAPTAALHFTPELMRSLAERGVDEARLTLHVGAGTFLPVKAEDTAEHAMHAEWGRIDADTADRLNAARARGGRIVACGTTALRLLESAAAEDGTIRPFMGETDIFITPGYRFRAVDLLLTNFHLPKSTLFMLVSAFCGLERMKAAYAHAIQAGYRFYSYGDACLLERREDAA